MVSESKVYCPVAWNSISVLPDGRLRLCCHASDDHLIDQKTLSKKMILNEIKETEFIKETRKSFLKNEAVKACDVCVSTEACGNKSAREELNDFFPSRNYQEDDEMIIEYLDISFSNECNMQCPMCSSNYSSMWEREDANFTRKRKGIDQELIDSELFHTITKNVKLILIQGGEPFLSKSHIPFLNHLIKNSKTSEVVLDYVTNFSLPIKKEVVDIWKKFKEVNIYISLEGVGPVYDITRPPQKWKKQEKLFSQIIELASQSDLKVNFNIKTVIQVLNIFDIKNIIEYFRRFQDFLPFVPEFSLLNYPSHLTVGQISKESRDEVVEEYELYLDSLEIQSFSVKNNKNIRTLRNMLSEIKSIDEIGINEKLLYQIKYFQKKYKLDYSPILKKIN